MRENPRTPLPLRVRPSRLAAMAVAVMLAAVAPRLYAQVRVAVVDMQRALLETDQGRIAKNQLKGLFQKRQEELDRRQQALKLLGDQLKRDSSHLDQPTLQHRMEDYQKQLVDLQQNFQEYQQELAQREAELTKQIYVNLEAVIREMSQREGLTAVFEQAGVVWARQDLDMTDRVVQAYNHEYPAREGAPAAAPASPAPAAGGAPRPGAAPAPRPAANPHPRGEPQHP